MRDVVLFLMFWITRTAGFMLIGNIIIIPLYFLIKQKKPTTAEVLIFLVLNLILFILAIMHAPYLKARFS